MAEFPAIALNQIGKFSGQCLIYLTGAAVTVKRPDGSELATWPYNVIRQFRAEDESGKFSFLSGRRGPFGLAEYVFELTDQILTQLQDVLTQFTGAQFNQINEKRRPPSYAGSVSSVGSLNDSFSSPKKPALPPRSPQHSMSVSQLQTSERVRSSKLPHYFSDTSVTMPPPNRTERKSPLRETWELRPGYETLGAQPSPKQKKGKMLHADTIGGVRTGTSPLYSTAGYSSTKKTSKSIPGPIEGLRTMDERRESDVLSDVFSPGSDSSSDGIDHGNTAFLRRQTAPDIHSQLPVSAQDDDHIHTHPLVRQQTEPTFSTLPYPLRKKRHEYEEADVGSRPPLPPPNRKSDPGHRHLVHTNYDHLPADIDVPHLPARSKSFSPEPSPSQTKPECLPDFSNLDFCLRSSPQVRNRPITPEFARHLRKFGQDPDKMVNLSTFVRERRSPELKRRAQTLQGQLYDSPRSTGYVPSDKQYDSPRSIHPIINPQNGFPMHPTAAQLKQGLYNSPSDTHSLYMSPTKQHHGDLSAEGLYQSPRSHSQTPGDSERMHIYEDPKEQIIDEVDYSSSTPNVPDNTYQVPPKPRPIATLDAYDSPRTANLVHDPHSTYNVPQANAYTEITLRDLENGHGLYSTPQSANAMLRNQYELVDIDKPRPMTRGLRHARSFESLVNKRVQPPQRRLSPEVLTPTKGNPYVDIDLQPQHPNQPPTSPLSENLYAEIPDNPRFRYILSPNRDPVASSEAQSLYSVPRPTAATRTAVRPDPGYHYITIPGESEEVSSLRSNVMKEAPTAAKDLAKQGYELCMPVERAMTLSSTVRSPPRNIPRSNYNELLEKGSLLTSRSTQRPRYPSEQTQSAEPSDSITQPSSVPNDSPLTDEYVIITRSAPRKISQPQNIPHPQGGMQGEEYEVMGSAHLSLSKTPSPRLGVGSKEGSPIPTQQGVNNLRRSDFSEHFYGNVIHSHTGSVPYTEPFYGNIQRDDLESMSDIGSPDAVIQDGHVGQSTIIYDTVSKPLSVPQRKLVRIASGSPHDSDLDLRHRSRSVGNLLDKEKRVHTYVNVSENQGDSSPPQTDKQTAPPVPEKRPIPLPRKPEHKSALLRPNRDQKNEKVEARKHEVLNTSSEHLDTP